MRAFLGQGQTNIVLPSADPPPLANFTCPLKSKVRICRKGRQEEKGQMGGQGREENRTGQEDGEEKEEREQRGEREEKETAGKDRTKGLTERTNCGLGRIKGGLGRIIVVFCSSAQSVKMKVWM